MSKNINSDNLTPMMVQFYSIKEKFPDSILFFRMGDFYEMFGEDAITASKLLGIALTSRNKNSENQMPMCGVPHHSYKPYLLKLLKLGQKVAICDQLENPALAKGIVKRGVTQVITPATVLDAEELTGNDNNFLGAVYLSKDIYYFAIADVSTGEIYLQSTELSSINELVVKYNLKEILTQSPLKLESSVLITPRKAIKHQQATTTIFQSYTVNALSSLGIISEEFAIPLAMIISYADDLMLKVPFAKPKLVANHNRVIIDSIAAKTLELVSSGDKETETSIFSLLNHTKTPMGARFLKQAILNPSREIEVIRKRQDIIEYFYNNIPLTQELLKLMSGIYDVERIINKIVAERINPRELVWLKNSLQELPRIADILEGTGVPDITVLGANFSKMASISALIEMSITDDPPITIKEGGIIKSGYSKIVDELRLIKTDSRQLLANMEAKLKSDTKINQLKIGYNKVFGYFIEISKSHLAKVPPYLERKQTLVNAERFVTGELKELENKILNAEERLNNIEYELFSALRVMLAENIQLLRSVASDIAQLDFYLSLGVVALNNKYHRPEMIESNNGEIYADNVRHPVVEHLNKNSFVSNSVRLDNQENLLLIITGPNMAGKSTYIRSIAITVLLAHIGSFVPAKNAKISLVDRIFTRVGANDNISRGESTFMVEMVETANILNNATKDSLIILDEVGRGTSTYDGVSIAWAVCEHIINKTKAKTLFATHYHELSDIPLSSPQAKNYTVSVKEQNGEVIFLHRIVPGFADKTYGIYVAMLAGIPKTVITRATEVLGALEKSEHEDDGTSKLVTKKSKDTFIQPILVFDEDHPAIDKLKEIDINNVTPIEAMNILIKLKGLTDEYK